MLCLMIIIVFWLTTGAKSSGDIDILLGHPSYSSVDSKKPSYVKSIVQLMEEVGFVTDSLSLGESKFMVRMSICIPYSGYISRV